LNRTVPLFFLASNPLQCFFETPIGYPYLTHLFLNSHLFCLIFRCPPNKSLFTGTILPSSILFGLTRRKRDPFSECFLTRERKPASHRLVTVLLVIFSDQCIFPSGPFLHPHLTTHSPGLEITVPPQRAFFSDHVRVSDRFFSFFSCAFYCRFFPPDTASATFFLWPVILLLI